MTADMIGKLVLHGEAAMRRPRSERGRPKSSPVTVIRVDPAVWQYALQLCEGDATRLTITDERTVLISNSGRAQLGAARH